MIPDISRRKILKIAPILAGSISGCTSARREFGLYNQTQVKEEATEVPYEELYRNISEYEGESIYFPNARLTDIADADGGSFEYLFSLNSGSLGDSHIIWGNWDGDPFREDDRVRIWGIVTGVNTYTSLVGEKTVPEIDIIDMEQVTVISGGAVRDP